MYCKYFCTNVFRIIVFIAQYGFFFIFWTLFFTQREVKECWFVKGLKY